MDEGLGDDEQEAVGTVACKAPKNLDAFCRPVKGRCVSFLYSVYGILTGEYYSFLYSVFVLLSTQ